MKNHLILFLLAVACFTSCKKDSASLTPVATAFSYEFANMTQGRVLATTDNYIIVAGQTVDASDKHSMTVCKLDLAGNLVWQKDFSDSISYSPDKFYRSMLLAQ